MLWIPGMDHAGIATQVVVEKYLQKAEGISRHELGREKFLSRIDNWRKSKEDVIYEQLKSFGSSLDWSRKFFTMDEVLIAPIDQLPFYWGMKSTISYVFNL